MAQISYWSENDWDSDEKHMLIKDKNCNVLLKEMLLRCENTLPSINTIEIETINRCNNDCSFCPVSKGNDIRIPQRMSEELFYNIINQLRDMQYSGYVSLFSNNEPLLDVRIFDFLKYAKENLPHAKHAMYTNGLLLTREKYQELVKYLDYLIIDNYSDELELLDNIKQIVEDSTITDGNCKVQVAVRKKTQILSNRGGIAPNKTKQNRFLSPCTLPFFQMVVRPDGKISRCCQDAYGKMTCSDLSVETIQDAWTSPAFRTMRSKMIAEGRQGVKQCVSCDIFGLYNYFPEIWVNEYTEAFLSIVKERSKKYKNIVVCATYSKGEQLVQLLAFHGIYVDVLEEDIECVEEDTFYIFTQYDWDLLEHFQMEDIGEKIVVFENPNNFLLQSKEVQRKDRDGKESLRVIHEAEKNKKLVLFGVGKQCKDLLKNYGWNVLYYVDNNTNRIGDEFEGRIIYSPSKLLEDTDALVVITCYDYRSVKRQLKEMGIERNRIVNGNILL